LFYGLAALSKESAAALPAAVVWLSVVSPGKGKWYRQVLDIVPFAIVAVAFGALQYLTGTHTDEEVLTRGGLSFGFAPEQTWVITDLITASLPGPWGEQVALLPSLQPRPIALVLLGIGFALYFTGSRAAPFAAGWAIAMGIVYVPFVEAIEDRYTYLPTLAVALLLASILDSVRQLVRRPAGRTAITVAAGGVAALVILSGVPKLAAKVQNWRTAGTIATRALDQAAVQYPRPATGSNFAFLGLPDNVNGAFVFRNGLAEAIRLEYNDPDLGAIRVAEGGPPPGSLVVDLRTP
jgi:hypothetical protein